MVFLGLEAAEVNSGPRHMASDDEGSALHAGLSLLHEDALRRRQQNAFEWTGTPMKPGPNRK